MNFLAHIFLSNKNPYWIIGNYVADFIKNNEVQYLDIKVQEGVLIHRKIDTFTDNDATVRKSVHRLHPILHKYSPVAIDVFYDFLLANTFEIYSTQPLRSFADEVYATLEEYKSYIPEKIHHRMDSMIAHDWLMLYTTEEGLRNVFLRMEKRTAFTSHFSKATDALLSDIESYKEDFSVFFPNIIEYLGIKSTKIDNYK